MTNYHRIDDRAIQEEDAALFPAMRAGACGYLLKGAHNQELLQTMRAVAGGQVLFGASTASRIMAFFQDVEVEQKSALLEESFLELTPRELEVLQLIVQGSPNSQIAEKLVFTDKTVWNHITSIFGKLQVVDQAQAIIMDREAGLRSAIHKQLQ